MNYQSFGKNIWIVCTGLGRINRGFESHASQLAALLSNSPLTKRIVLFSGKKLNNTVGVKNVSILCLYRDHWANKLILKKFHSRFLLEQISFFISLIPSILFNQPKLIYLGEYELYCYLFKFRKILGLKYSLCLHTGGMAIPGLFNERLDFIHHVNPYLTQFTSQYQSARQFKIPHFLDTNFTVDEALVKKIKDLANGKLIWLSVGSIDMHFKRMDLLCKMLTPFSEAIFPIILGESTNETDEIKNLFSNAFGKNEFYINKVSRSELGAYYTAADAFILCTDVEPFGLVFLEAAYFELPIFCNDNSIVRSILDDHANYLNMNDIQASNEILTKYIYNKEFLIKKLALSHYIVDKYGINTLLKHYINMFEYMGAA